jgi:hypothetical protein
MKTNKYADLIRFGFSQKMVMSLNESSIDTLHKNLIKGKKKETKEQVTTTTKQLNVTKIPSNTAKTTGANVGNVDIKQDASGNIIATQLNQGKEKSKGEKIIKDGEMAEAKKKESKLNPWAICTAQLGKQFKTTERSEWSPKQNAKYERCVKDVKQSISENKLPFEVILEKKILSLVEKHIQPKMKKRDLMDLIQDKKTKTPITTLGAIDVKEDTKEAPTKPTTKPGTKTPPNPDKDSPYKPKVKPAPKAKMETKEDTAPAPTKPTTKPGTKTPPNPDKDSPYKPKTLPNPKAKKTMPSWMSFESIGIKLKK